MTRVFNTKAPRLNLPTSIREGGARVDVRPDISFDGQVEWHGLRWAWSRMVICPCESFNEQTHQVRPGCPKCNGLGFRPVRPKDWKLRTRDVGQIDPIQRLLIERNFATIISCITNGVSSQPDMFASYGEWAHGSVLLTFRNENKVGYYDRMTLLDSTAPFNELLKMPEGNTLKLRYPATELNALLTDDVDFGEGDVTLVDGNVVFASGKAPAPGTQVAVNYLRYPVFTVLEFPHLIRSTVVRTKRPRKTASRPVGDVFHLPLQCLARLEHLPLETGT